MHRHTRHNEDVSLHSPLTTRVFLEDVSLHYTTRTTKQSISGHRCYGRNQTIPHAHTHTHIQCLITGRGGIQKSLQERCIHSLEQVVIEHSRFDCAKGSALKKSKCLARSSGASPWSLCCRRQRRSISGHPAHPIASPMLSRVYAGQGQRGQGPHELIAC